MCKRPMKGFILGTYMSDGKRKKELKIVPYEVDYIRRIGDRYIPTTGKLRDQSCDEIFTDFVEIPCGSCLDCRLAYSRSWAERCLVEVPYHDTAFFLTLTYDDEHLPSRENINPDTGEITVAHSLEPRDLQLFWKRLRKHYAGYRISYFACGEYGSSTARPHYHAIVYGMPLEDLSLYKQSAEGNNYYNSATLDRLWGNGFVVVGDVTYQSAAYTARYCLKKQVGKVAREDTYLKNGLLPEFTRMSTRPAIGRQFYEDHKHELYTLDSVSIATPSGGRKIRSNKYYDKLYETEFPEDYERIKECRRARAEANREIKMSYTDKTYLEQLETELENLESKFQNLRRKEL